MPSGYQDRLSDTYWTGTNLTWSGTLWDSISATTECRLTPTGSMDTDLDELRVRLSLPGVKDLRVYQGTTLVDIHLLSGSPDAIIVVRAFFAPTPYIRFLFDAAATVNITEIEAGYNGAHF